MDSVQLFLEKFIVAIVEASREIVGMWDMLMILPTRETRYVSRPVKVPHSCGHKGKNPLEDTSQIFY